MVRTTLQRRVSVMGGAFLVVVLLLTLFLANSLDSLGRSDDDPVSVTQDAAADLNAFRADLVRAQTTHSMYIAAADVDTLVATGKCRAAQLDILASAQAGVRADIEKLPAPVRPQLESALDDVDKWRAVAEEQAGYKAAADRPNLDRTTRNAPAAVAFLSSYDALQEASAAIAAVGHDELTKADAERDESQMVQLIVAAIALLLVPTALYLVRRWVLRPLTNLSQQLRRVGGGDLQTPVSLAGPPELAAVAASAETMRRRILDELADAVSAREALKQGQPLVAEVRDQLAAHDLPLMAGWVSAAALRPAEGLLAGDWYDVLPLPDGRFAVVVADVSGHGARAGIVAIQLKRLLEAALHLAPEPDLALAMAARVFSDEAERFASCVVAVVNPDSGVITYANAGHPAPLVLRRDGDEVRVIAELEATGPLLSWLHLDTPGAWRTRTTSLAPGSLLVVYTDGLTEARPTGSTAELGVDGVLMALRELPELSPQAVVDEALDVARRFSGGRARDDVTLVVLARAGGVADGALGAGELPAVHDGAELRG
ncbi:MAG: PP2C family protein-serine/threonine phosphatase [Janthinobacterium lividum]